MDWKQPYFKLNDVTEKTVKESACGKYFVTLCVYLLAGMDAYSDRYIAEHREDGKVLWFSRHRTENAARKAVEKRARAVARGLKKPRQRRTRTDLLIKRKKS